jgi:hypothetical protein
MRAFLCALVLGLLSLVPASAAPCVVDALSTYVGLGGAGCTLGPFTIKDFNFTVLSSGGGAVPVTPANISVTPMAFANGYGFQFFSNGFSVTNGGSVQYLLEYVWDPGQIRSLEDVMFAESPVAPGTATITTTGCLDAPFIAGICGTSTVSSTVYHFGGVNTHLTDTVSFAPISSMGIRAVIDLQANGASADFTSFRSSVLTPEPSYALPVAAALALWLRRFRR